MKSYTLSSFLCLIIIISSLSSCDNDCRQDYTFYEDYLLAFHIADKRTGQDLLQIGVNRYNRDTVEIYDRNLEPLGIHPDTDGSLVLYFLHNPLDRDEPLHTDLGRRYYLYFGEGDYDTLNFAYRIGLDQCSDKILTQWSASYNDSLYVNFTADPPNSTGVTFVK